jgi:hypothetical protein
MRLLAAVFAACSTIATAAVFAGQGAQGDSTVQFLISAAAGDFYAHRPPDPARFRQVRFVHLLTATGEKVYMLCGEFLPVQSEGKAQWVPFATIRTSGYEQWLGAEARRYCKNSSLIGDNMGDLSTAVEDKLDSLRRGGGRPP